MGGFGSGRWGNFWAKATTEGQHSLDTRWLRKRGFLRPGTSGSLSWSNRERQTGSICYRMEADRMILNYRHRSREGDWESIEQRVFFDLTPCNYGGNRTWFLCPRCSRRVAVLYGGKYFLCRQCHDLAYGSQQENQIFRLMRKAQKIRRKLGASHDLSEPIWSKPKNMHRKTFNRLRREAVETKELFMLKARQRFGAELDMFL